MENSTVYPLFQMDPILPPSTLVAQPPLFPFIRDQHLPYVLPQIFYWLIGISFHYMEVMGLCSSYKLHTPAEFLKRNRATRTQVVRTALTQQFFMCVFGYLMSEKAELTHTHAYGVAVWAKRLRVVPRIIPVLLRALGVDNQKLGNKIGGNFGALLVKGSLNYCLIADPATQLSDSCLRSMTNFSRLEIVGAAFFYWVVVPSLQFLTSLFLADTMQYMTHRALHNIPFLYRNFHYMHHEVHVNFAYGAFYNHPVEGIPIDGVGFPICLKIAKMSTRQSALFGVIWTVKTVVDHCGYHFPYDPNNLLCPKSQWYHDLHHQSWGMKYNFSAWTPLWDYLLGTMWDATDTKAQGKYARMKALVDGEFERDMKGTTEHGRDVAGVSAREV